LGNVNGQFSFTQKGTRPGRNRLRREVVPIEVFTRHATEHRPVAHRTRIACDVGDLEIGAVARCAKRYTIERFIYGLN
jgi:hypothetical protein